MSLTNFVNYFIPEKYREEKELYRKSKFIVWFVFIVNIIGIFFILLTFFSINRDLPNIIMGFTMPLISTLTILHFRKRGSFIITTHLLCGILLIGMFVLPYTTGGIYSPDLPTIYILPLFALIMGNFRIGIFYSSLTLAMLIGFYVLTLGNSSYFFGLITKLPIEYFLFNIVLNMVVILFLVFRNENLRLSILGELRETNIVITQKSKEITDSINYAKRIQTAILPTATRVKEKLPNSFILYLPKDIVSGDFYWMETIGDQVLFAACDCTGHGVPGAMVSVVCHNALNRAVKEFELKKPSDILNKTAELVIDNFANSDQNINDGMDISLCSLNTKTKTLEWAGANNPLWIIQNGEIKETKADKKPIGRTDNKDPFTNHSYTLNNGESIYLFTDGFADQFGGEIGQKKLTRKRFKNLLLSNQNKDLSEQKNALEKFFAEYKKDTEQIDDVLVIGVKV